jgi:3-phenylpropionate/trans-cinnamate dioxygenase ferredoxin reductase subunit
MKDVVIVGGSLAGARAAETLREEGFDGSIRVVGEESRRPYDRPPLSKQVLTGEWDADRATIPVAVDGLDVEWVLGRSAVGVDVAARRLGLDGGEQLPFDGLVIATGARPRRLPGTEGLAGVHVLRTLDDSLRLRADLDATPNRVVVIGAGFIGAEVAATCRERGLPVTMIEALPVPLVRALGEEMGAACADIHRDHDVDLRLGVGVSRLRGSDRVEAVELDDGSVIEAEVVVVGIGVVPNTEWLADSGLTIGDGVICDETCLAAPGIVAAGDVARWPNRRFGVDMRVEHWDNALDQGAAAARRLLASDETAEPYAPVPWFWSDQYDRKIQLAGRPGADDEVRVVAGSVEERRFVAFYGRAGRLVGVLGMNRPRHVMQYRMKIEEGIGWEDALAEVADNG